MNQGKFEVVKQEIARVNINILRIGERKWTRTGEFKSDDHYIYYCGQESLRRNGVVIMAHKRAQNAISLIQFSCSLVSDSLRPHELQHTSLPVHHQLPEFTQTLFH